MHPAQKWEKNSKSETSLEVKKIDANSKFMFRLWCAEEIGTFLQRLVSGKEFWHLQNLKMCALKIIFDIWKTLLENAYHQVKVSQNLALKHSMMKLSQLSFMAKVGNRFGRVSVIVISVGRP